MKKKSITILLIVITIIFGSCTSVKNGFVKSGNNQDDALQIAILDFTKTIKLFKKDSVFFVQIVGLENNDDLMVVRIGKNNRKLLLTKDTKVGSSAKLPSRYLVKDGKLFFWWDDSHPLTEEAIAIFKKYDLLQDDKNGIIKIPDFVIDDAKKAAHYYFCKTDISNYKKIITNKGIGYYASPTLKCRAPN